MAHRHPQGQYAHGKRRRQYGTDRTRGDHYHYALRKRRSSCQGGRNPGCRHGSGGTVFDHPFARNTELRRYECSRPGGYRYDGRRIHVENGEEWIHITPPADGKFTVTLDDNTASTERRAYINVIPDDKTIVTQKLLVIQEPAEVEPVLELILPEGTDPEKGIIFDPAGGFIRFDLNVEPQTAEWTVSLSDENASEWLVVTPTVTPNAHSILLQAKPNPAETNRTTQLTFSHASENVAPVTITVTQKAKANVLSTIEEDIDVTMPQARIECKANNTTRDYPFIQWTLTLYEEGLTYNKIWGRWEGAGARIVIHMTGDPANEEDVELEARTYTVVPYEKYTKQPLVDRLPGWVCTGSSNGKSLYPSGTWYQTLSGGAVTGCANATEGTVTVTRNGDEYTISWDFVSDAGKQVKGSYTGPVNIIF